MYHKAVYFAESILNVLRRAFGLWSLRLVVTEKEFVEEDNGSLISRNVISETMRAMKREAKVGFSELVLRLCR